MQGLPLWRGNSLFLLGWLTGQWALGASPTLSFNARYALLFTWELETWTQVLTLAHQTFRPSASSPPSCTLISAWVAVPRICWFRCFLLSNCWLLEWLRSDAGLEPAVWSLSPILWLLHVNYGGKDRTTGLKQYSKYGSSRTAQLCRTSKYGIPERKKKALTICTSPDLTSREYCGCPVKNPLTISTA